MQAFEIQSMTCGGCAGRVARAIKDLDAQAKVEFDMPTRTVRVQTTEDRAAVTAALVDAGYRPK